MSEDESMMREQTPGDITETLSPLSVWRCRNSVASLICSCFLSDVWLLCVISNLNSLVPWRRAAPQSNASQTTSVWWRQRTPQRSLPSYPEGWWSSAHPGRSSAGSTRSEEECYSDTAEMDKETRWVRTDKGGHCKLTWCWTVKTWMCEAVWH